VQDFTRKYFSFLPVVIVVSGLLGWFLAGRALRPVNSVAATAQRITHSSLNMQIPPRNAGDELDRLIEAFNLMMQRLNLSFEQIRQFSTDVSHELRTPLTVVRGQLEVAMFTASTVTQYREAMADALEGVDRLSNIVRALLMLSQAESGQVVLQKTQLDFAELIRDQVDQYQIPARSGRRPAVRRVAGDVQHPGGPDSDGALGIQSALECDQVHQDWRNREGATALRKRSGEVYRGRYRRRHRVRSSAAHLRSFLPRAIRRSGKKGWDLG